MKGEPTGKQLCVKRPGAGRRVRRIRHRLSKLQSAWGPVSEQLIKITGLPAEFVPTRVTSRDRTYAFTLGLHTWLAEQNISVLELNILKTLPGAPL